MPKKRSHGDSALYPIRGGKLWRGVVDLGIDPITGKRLQPMVHAKTQRACKDKLDKLKDEIRANGGRPLKKGVKLNDWAERWFTDYGRPDLDPKTYATYRSTYKNWIAPVAGHKAVDQVMPSDITAMLRRIAGAGRSMSLARQTYVIVDQMLEQGRRERLSDRNVCRDVDRPGSSKKRQSRAPAKRDALDEEAVMALLAAAAKRKNGSMWWFKILTGQRQTEILGAVLEDLEILDEGEGGYYTVNWKLEELTSEHGCGVKDDTGAWPCGKKRGGSCSDRRFIVPDNFNSRQLAGRLHLTEPKSQTGKRVPLVDVLVRLIERDLKMNTGPNPHGLIWRHDDGSPILPAEDAAGWRELLHEVGLINEDQLVPGGTEMTGHVARHTTITALAALGVDWQLIGEIVGQSDQRVTANYRHARDAERMAAMRQLGDKMLENVPGIKELSAAS